MTQLGKETEVFFQFVIILTKLLDLGTSSFYPYQFIVSSGFSVELTFL
jgi:hypothetical protein